MEDTLRRWSAAWVLLALLAVCLGGTSPYFERFMNANERPRLLQAMALIDEGEWAIDGAAARGLAPGIDVARGEDGRLYPNKPPGATIPAALAWVGLTTFDSDGEVSLRGYTFVARVLGGWLPLMVLCALLLVECRRVAGELPALAAVAVFALASPMLAQAHVLFGHSLAACLLFAGVCVLVRAREPRPAALGGALAASAVGVEYIAVFAALPIAAVLFRQPRRSAATLAAALVGALVPIALLATYHHAVFGSVFSTGYHNVVRPEFAEIHESGLLGLGVPTATAIYEHTLSPWGGLLYFAPTLALAPLLVPRAEWRARTGMALGLAVFVTILLVNFGLQQTGGWRVGPRYLLCALPFLVPPLAVALRRNTAPVTVVAAIALIGWSAFINFLAANHFPHLIPEGNPLADLLLPLWGRSVHGPLHAVLPAGAATVMIALVSALALGWTLSAALPRTPGVHWLFGLAGALTLYFILVRVPAAPEASESLRLVERIWEPSGAVSVTSRPLDVQLPIED